MPDGGGYKKSGVGNMRAHPRMPKYRIHVGNELALDELAAARCTGCSVDGCCCVHQRSPRSREAPSATSGSSGNRRVEPETVRSYLQFSVGDAYDAGKVDQSIKALFATGLFSDVRIDREGAGVLVTVVENPVINQVAFEGNSEVDTETLSARSSSSRARCSPAPAPGRRAAHPRRLSPPGPFCRHGGAQDHRARQNRVNLVFEITEGEATKVKGINFIGNHAFTDSQLRDIITTTQSRLFDFLKGTNVYDPDRLSSIASCSGSIT